MIMEEQQDDRKSEQKKVLTLGIIIVVVIAAALAVLYFTVLKKPAAGPAVEKIPVEEVKPLESEKPSAEKTEELLPIPTVGLDESDPVVREFGLALSFHPTLPKWLQSRDLIRKFVAAVDNIANGMSPRSHIDFFTPAGNFKEVVKDGRTVIDESSYARYNPATEVFLSLDSGATVRLYRSLKPLLQEAYRELGYPGTDFEETLVRAARELLSTPVVRGPVPLESRVVSFAMADETLENLSQAQKHFFRMGPASVQAIQDKIREMVLRLGVPEAKLPRTKFYSPPLGRS
jgi:hypothetical protein